MKKNAKRMTTKPAILNRKLVRQPRKMISSKLKKNNQPREAPRGTGPEELSIQGNADFQESS